MQTISQTQLMFRRFRAHRLGMLGAILASISRGDLAPFAASQIISSSGVTM